MTVSRPRESVAGIALAAAAGFGLGMVAGLAAGEWLGDVNADRVRRAVGRLRDGSAGDANPAAIQRTVYRALRADPATRYLKLRVRALGERLLELIGTVPSAPARERAGQAARAAAPGRAVINRLLVEGEDVPRGSTARPAQH